MKLKIMWPFYILVESNFPSARHPSYFPSNNGIFHSHYHPKHFYVLCLSAELPKFTNPITTTKSQNPSVLKVGASYFLTFDSESGYEIVIFKSPYLTDFRYAENKTICRAPGTYSQLSTSAIQKVDGQLVIYFSMLNEPKNILQLFVITAKDPENPLGSWSVPKRILENIWDGSASHGTVMVHNQTKYFVFTSDHLSTRGSHRSIYIAPMKSATEISKHVVLLKTPSEDWECIGMCSNNAPAFISNRNVSYLVYSAGSNTNSGSSLAYMRIMNTKNPLISSNWERANGPIFSKDNTEEVYGIGHASFTTSPDNTETWMIYHGTSNPTYVTPTISPGRMLYPKLYKKWNITDDLVTRAARIEWDELHGTPIFPKPLGFDSAQKRPSGEPQMFTNPISEGAQEYSSVIRLEDFYYLLRPGLFGSVKMYKSRTLTNWTNAESKAVIRSPGIYSEHFASNLQLVNGELYIFSTLDKNCKTATLFAYKAENSSDPMGAWGDPVDVLRRITYQLPSYGTVMTHNGRLYFVWTDGTTPVSIYISPMANPTTAVGPMTRLRKPMEAWECNGECIIDAPYFVYRNNTSFLFFSAGQARDPNYCISYMSIESGKDPLDVLNWYSAPGPVFGRNDGERVYGPGGASFINSPDGTETWMVYRASERNYPFRFKTLRIDKIEWSEQDGSPIFPMAHSGNRAQPIPRS